MSLGGGTSGTPQKLPQIDQTATGSLGQIYDLLNNNTAKQLLPQYATQTQEIMSNPYAPAAQAGAGVAGNIGTNAATQGAAGGAATSQAGQNLLPYSSSILQTGFDPQQALYDRTSHDLTQQVRAGEAARGLNMSPVGAGIENQALSNFNIDWQNAQLGRQTQALGAAGSNATTAGNLIGQGQDIGGAASTLYGQSAALPYSTANAQSLARLGALDTQSQAGANANTQQNIGIQDLLSYLGIGSNFENAAVNQQRQNQSSTDDFLSTIGSLIGIGAGFL